MTSIRQLVEISHFYGNNKDFVIAAGGNTSFKDGKFMWIKASGTSLANLTDENLVVLDREKSQVILKKRYSEYPDEREKQIKSDLMRACVYPERNLRPSVETSLHEIIDYNYVVHTHPTLVNAVLCSVNAESFITKTFAGKALYVPYADPGYALFKKVQSLISSYRENYNSDPTIIFIQNHGVFVAANSIEEIKLSYNQIISAISPHLITIPDTEPLPVDDKITSIVPAIRMMLSDQLPKTLIFQHHELLKHYYSSSADLAKISSPLNPDVVLYCNAKAICIENTEIPDEAIKEAFEKIEAYKRSAKCSPKILVLKNLGVLSVGDNFASAKVSMDVFEDQMKIAFYSQNFGGPNQMGEREITIINNQVMDNLQRLLQKQTRSESAVTNKTAVILDNGDGLYANIAEDLLQKKANVVIAIEDETKGQSLAETLNSRATENKAVFIKTNGSDLQSVKSILFETIKCFGGIDVFIYINTYGEKSETSNQLDNFQTLITETTEILKLQSLYKQFYCTDIIEIKGQPGLFGIEQIEADLKPIALELMPYSIKLNRIKPGNIFSSALWGNPQTGLFKQCLEEGKFSEAKNVNDVKSFVESKIPARRGCEIKDILRAIYYLIEQEYETGQTINVTGGNYLLK